MAEKSTENSEK